MNKELAREILKRVNIDQKMRRIAALDCAEWKEKVDIDNTKWLKSIIKKNGWPTISMVGKKASKGAWLLAQHAECDIAFQKKVLKLLQKIFSEHRNEVRPADIAYMTDRILVLENKEQIFGTQFYMDKVNKKFKPRPIRDIENVDKRRKEYGLSGLVEYEREINRNFLKIQKNLN